jgi:DNA-binding MarR family transcriptional regulator
MNLTAEQLETAQRLRSVFGKLSSRLRPTEAGSAADLSPTRVTVLLTTVRRGPVKLADVAAEVGVNPTMLSRAIGQLVDAGLVQRSSDRTDRRSAWLEPTAAGRRLAEQMQTERTAALEVAMEGLQEDERQLIHAALPALEQLARQLKERRA